MSGVVVRDDCIVILSDYYELHIEYVSIIISANMHIM